MRFNLYKIKHYFLKNTFPNKNQTGEKIALKRNILILF